jgi:hypothetical protein
MNLNGVAKGKAIYHPRLKAVRINNLTRDDAIRTSSEQVFDCRVSENVPKPFNKLQFMASMVGFFHPKHFVETYLQQLEFMVIAHNCNS